MCNLIISTCLFHILDEYKDDCRVFTGSCLTAAANVDGVKCRRKLFVGQLPSDISERQLRPLFAKFGRIVQLKIRRDDETSDSMCVYHHHHHHHQYQ